MVRIHVVDRNGRPVSGAYVHVSWYGGGHSSGRTDRDGYIDFDVSPGTGTVTVERKEVFTGIVEGMKKVVI